MQDDLQFCKSNEYPGWPAACENVAMYLRDLQKKLGGEVVGEVTEPIAGVGTILIDPSEGDMAEYLASLALMLERPTRSLLPAHGPAIDDGPSKLREYIAHRTMRENRVLAALGEQTSASLDELLPTAYGDTPRPLWPLAKRVLRAHLDKLVKEHRVRDVGSGRWTSH